MYCVLSVDDRGLATVVSVFDIVSGVHTRYHVSWLHLAPLPWYFKRRFCSFVCVVCASCNTIVYRVFNECKSLGIVGVVFW